MTDHFAPKIDKYETEQKTEYGYLWTFIENKEFEVSYKEMVTIKNTKGIEVV